MDLPFDYVSRYARHSAQGNGLQPNQRAEASRFSFFGAVREPVLGVTGGADFGYFDLCDARVFKLQAVGLPQVEVEAFAARLEQGVGAAVERGADLTGHVRAHLVVVGADGGTDGGAHVARVCPVAAAHGLEGGFRNAAHGSQPARVGEGNHSFLGVVEQERDAVRVAQEEGDAGIVGGEDVGLGRLEGQVARRVRVDNVGAVHQPHVMDGSGVASQRVEGADAVLAHVLDVIPHASADVERIPRRRADASLTREDRVAQSREAFEGEIADSVFVLEGHGGEGASHLTARTSLRVRCDALFCDREFFDEELACLGHGFFDVGIGEPGGAEAEERAGEHAQEGRGLAVGQEVCQPGKIELAEELREAVQPDGADGEEEPERPVQGREAAFRQAEDEAEEQEAEVDSDVAFAQRDLVADSLIADELPCLQAGDVAGVAQVFEACDLIESLYAFQPRFFERIVGLLTVQEEGAKAKLMAQRTIHGVDGAGRPLRACLHEGGSEEGQADINRHEEIEQEQVVFGDPVGDAVGGGNLLSAADARLVVRSADFVQLAAPVGGRAEGHA